jgi:hypothetical protein
MRWKISIDGSDEISRGQRCEFEIEKNFEDLADGSIGLSIDDGTERSCSATESKPRTALVASISATIVCTSLGDRTCFLRASLTERGVSGSELPPENRTVTEATI